MIRSITILLLLLAVRPAAGVTYYVSPSGSDSHPGTPAAPWRTIGKGNRTLQAGDTLMVRAGVYEEDINPVRSGRPDAPIVFLGSGEGQAVLRGPGADDEVESVVAIGWPGTAAGWGMRSHIHVQGFVIDPVSARYGVALSGRASDRNVVRDCRLINRVGGKRDGILVYGVNHTLLENNTIEGQWHLGIITTGVPKYTVIRGNTIRGTYNSGIDIQTSYGEMEGTLIEGNVIAESRIEDGIQFEYDYSMEFDPGGAHGIVIRNNLIANNAENAIDCKGASELVIEGNTIYGHASDNNREGNRAGGSGAIMRGGYTLCNSTNVIVRGNILYDNMSGVSIPGSGWTVYHNTILGNNRDYEGPNSGYRSNRKSYFNGIEMYFTRTDDLTGIGVKNNLIGGHRGSEMMVKTTADLEGTEIDGNRYFNSEGLRFVDFRDFYDWDVLDMDAWRERLRSVPGVSGADEHSSWGDPAFRQSPERPLSKEAYDFSLNPGSAAIDAGVPLTTAVAAGRGTRLPVVHTRYFSDGYGIVDGDEIQFASTGERARIVSIDHEAGTLVLDRASSWIRGDGISLAYEGTGPDIGAVESSRESPDPAERPPDGPRNLRCIHRTESSLLFAWDIPSSASNGDAPKGYRVFRDGGRIAELDSAVCMDSDLLPDTPYRYEVFAVDGAGTLSGDAASGEFRTAVHPADEELFAFVTFGAIAGAENRRIPVSLNASKDLGEVPGPLRILESDGTVTHVDLGGDVPGRMFHGELLNGDDLAGGIARISLSGEIVGVDGRKSRRLREDTIRIDKDPPAPPREFIVR